MIKLIIDALSSIPNVVWSGLIASLVAFGGVFLSNRSNTQRLIVQLKHDSEQKEKDRLHNLRKEVYLKAAEETSKAGNHFGTIPTLDPLKTNISDGLSEFLSTSAKLQLISQPETSQAAAELTTRYVEILGELMIKAPPIHSANTKYESLATFTKQTNPKSTESWRK